MGVPPWVYHACRLEADGGYLLPYDSNEKWKLEDTFGANLQQAMICSRPDRLISPDNDAAVPAARSKQWV